MKAPFPRLERWCDPQWPAFMAWWLALPLAFLATGRTEKAVFFLGVAVYAGLLKWLGWAFLHRTEEIPPEPLSFPLELFAGLALATGWFYLRNLLGWFWPAAYSLLELRVLAVLVFAAHLAWCLGRLRTFQARTVWKTLLAQGQVCVPFLLVLALAFRNLAIVLHVQSTDPMFHAFSARIYRDYGLFFSHFNGGEPLVYTAGFGAINAVASACAGLSVVQSVNLQHPFWLFAGLFLIVSACGTLAKGGRAWLVWAVPAFLLLFPIHRLCPYYFYEGTPRQLAPALFIALALLPVVFPAVNRERLWRGAVLLGLLGALACALNPACVPYALLLFCLAAGLNLRRFRKAGRNGFGHALLVQGGCAALALLLVLGCDRFYGRLLQSGGRLEVTGQRLPVERPGFSAQAGWERMSQVEPLNLSREIVQPTRAHLPWLGLSLTVLAAALCFFKRQTPEACRALSKMALTAVALWLFLGYAVAFVTGGSPNTSWDLSLFNVYLNFLWGRIQLVLMFATALAAGTACLLWLKQAWSRRALAVAGSLTACGCAVLVRPCFQSSDLLEECALANSGCMGTVSPDDLAVVKWIDENVPPERGLVALACAPFRAGAEKHLYPVGGAQALPLYGHRLNFCFFQSDPGRGYSFDEYLAHMQTHFGAAWCVRNNIRFVFAPRNTLACNPGLAKAIDEKELVAKKTIGASVLYKVVPKEPAP